jgi:N-acetyl-gamma-glutamyl-phosphate reductase
MSKLRVGIVGASGYSGSVATGLVASHAKLRLAFATSDKLAGEAVSAHLGVRLDEPHLRFVANAEALERADQCDAVVLATSAEVSLRLAPAFGERGKQVIDLSGAFRLAAPAYPRWYGFEHTAPDWIARAHYGLPELFGAPPKGAIVANPGCYPTATLLAIAPLFREGLVETQGIVVDAKSGVTGAGRQSGEPYSFGEVSEDLRSYKVFTHQHTPEIARHLSRSARTSPPASGTPSEGEPPPLALTFTPHLLPIRRGLFATCYARPRPGSSATRVAECLADAYSRAAFVRVVPPDSVMIKRVVGTNFAHVGATANDEMVICFGAIDNLLKGAAGQAIQNLNLMNGWDEATGLDHLQRASP